MSALRTIDVELQLQRSGFSLDVKMQLPNSGISVLFGASGSGKTTVLRCVAGLEPEATGLVRVGEQVWLSSQTRQRLPAHQRSLGYVFQEASLFEHLNVRQNIAFGLRRTPRFQAQSLIDNAAELLGIAHLLDRSVQGLSGGERQRISIARALATQPQILLLDEPMAALDQARKQDLFPWLEKLRDELHIPMLYVTHSVDELTRLGNHLVVLDQGRVKASGPVAETFATLDSTAVQGEDFSTLIHGVIAERDSTWHLLRVEFDGGELWVRDDGAQTGSRIRLRVMARDVSIATRVPEYTSIQNHLKAVICAALPDAHPSQMLVKMQIGETVIVARITQRSWHTLGLAVGQTVWTQVKSVAVVS